MVPYSIYQVIIEWCVNLLSFNKCDSELGVKFAYLRPLKIELARILVTSHFDQLHLVKLSWAVKPLRDIVTWTDIWSVQTPSFILCWWKNEPKQQNTEHMWKILEQISNIMSFNIFIRKFFWTIWPQQQAINFSG